MRCDLRGLRPFVAELFKVLAYLLAARAGGIQIFLRVALDFGSAAASGFDLVAESAKPVHQLRLINGSGELLAVEESLRLESAKTAVLALGHIEDNDVGMKLRRSVAIHGPRRVMLEFRRDKLAGCFGRMIAADAGLRVPLQLVQGGVDGFTVGLAHAVITADKRGK